MPDEDSQLRARIAALSNTELARMLTVDAENYRVEALAIGREEAARRRLDVTGAAHGLEPSIPHGSAAKKRISLAFTRPFPVHELAGFRWAACLLVLSAAVEILGPALAEHGSSQQRALFNAVIAAGILEYLRIVYRLHRALQIVTDGGYPVTPRFAVIGHFIPGYNIYWLHGWSLRATQCAAKNGPVPTSAYFIPTAVFALGLLPGFHGLCLRLLLFFAAVRITTGTLLHAAREPVMRHTDGS